MNAHFMTTYYELSYRLDWTRTHHKNTLCDFFVERGVPPHEIVLSEDAEGLKISWFTPSKKIAARLKKNSDLQLKILKRKDWLDKWKQEYQTQPIGKKFLLIPSWQKKKNATKRLSIFLDPKSVFGSGTHASTRLILELIEPLHGKFESFLDLGTGTGILSVAAGKMGAKKILAMDHDLAAVKTARANLRLNQLKGKVMRVELKKAGPLVQTFDLVAANLFTSLLLEIKKLIFQSVRPGGWLAVSGIYDKNLKDINAGFRHPQFKRIRQARKDGWAGILFKRTI